MKRQKQPGSFDTTLKSVPNGMQVEALSENDLKLEQVVAKIEEQVNTTVMFVMHTSNSTDFTRNRESEEEDYF